MLRKRFAAGGDLEHDAGGVAHVEHRHAEHVPISVARVRVVGVLDADRPALVEAVFDLLADLFVAQIRQKREGALGDSHDGLFD